MLKRIRSGLTYANVMSTLAVFLILGGATAFAANQLAKNSVGSKQLKKNAVTMAKIKNNAVNSAKVADASLTGTDVADGSLTGADVKDGSLAGVDLTDGSVALADLAANSVNGSKVVNGSIGKDDVAAGTFLGGKVTTQFAVAAAEVPDGTSVSVDVFCPADQVALGGGARGDLTDSEATNVGSSRPIISSTNSGAPASGGTFTGWRATVQNDTGGVTVGILPEVWVICAALP
ncbi:MAG TPA: hypothetical protein VGO66_07960 [Solirubrobacterales bacterium]|nr:hypothetical protein [Solirubrobacterales bacterium]